MWFIARMGKLSPWSLFLRLAFAALFGYFAYVVVNSLLKLKVRYIQHTWNNSYHGDHAFVTVEVWPGHQFCDQTGHFSPFLPTYHSSYGVICWRRRVIGHALVDSAHGWPEVGQPQTYKHLEKGKKLPFANN